MQEVNPNHREEHAPSIVPPTEPSPENWNKILRLAEIGFGVTVMGILVATSRSFEVGSAIVFGGLALGGVAIVKGHRFFKRRMAWLNDLREYEESMARAKASEGLPQEITFKQKRDHSKAGNGVEPEIEETQIRPEYSLGGDACEDVSLGLPPTHALDGDVPVSKEGGLSSDATTHVGDSSVKKNPVQDESK